jgi:hypothetical protein
VGVTAECGLARHWQRGLVGVSWLLAVAARGSKPVVDHAVSTQADRGVFIETWLGLYSNRLERGVDRTVCARYDQVARLTVDLEVARANRTIDCPPVMPAHRFLGTGAEHLGEDVHDMPSRGHARGEPGHIPPQYQRNSSRGA